MIRTSQRLRRQFLALAAIAAFGVQPMAQSAETITMASTTSTEASGLLGFMLP